MFHISGSYSHNRLLAVFILLTHTINAIAVADDDEMIVIVRTVKTNYQHNDFNAAAFEKVIDNSVPQEIVIKPNQSISAAVKEHLRLWESASPRVYKKVLDYIANRNSGFADINMVRSGDTVLIPDIPRMAEVAKKEANFKKLETSTRVSSNATWSQNSMAYTSQPEVNDFNTGLGQTETQIRIVPLKVAKQSNVIVGDLSYEKVHGSSQYAIASLSMELTMSGQNAQVVNSLMTQKESDALSKLLKTSRIPNTKPLLVILDGAWPDNVEFKKTAGFTLEASDLIRSKFGLPASSSAEALDQNLLREAANSRTNFCRNSSDCEYPNLRHHSGLIKESLKQFVLLDKKPPLVDVIYLPTGTFQDYSINVLREMVRISTIANTVDQPIIRNPRPANYRSLQPYQGANEEAISTVFSSAGINIEPPTFEINNPEKVLTIKTNKGVLDGVMNFFWFYSIASERPVFVSLSWTTPKSSYPYLFRDDGPTVWLAAVGNTASHNITNNPIDFASRESFIAVQNTSDAGCPTSTFTNSQELNVHGLIFNGAVAHKICGTSFSTPRVAWLLAAREAIKGTPLQLNGSQNWTSFRGRNRAFISNLTKWQTGEARYRKTIWEILEEPQP